MKKLFLIFALVAIALSDSKAQDGKLAPGDIGNPCPPPSCVVRAQLMIDIFNFHKPRTECKTGFGLCMKTHVQYTCGYPPYCLTINVNNRELLNINNGKVTGWVQIQNGKADLHLPLAIQTQADFVSTDISQFTIDPNTIYFVNDQGAQFAKAKGGTYPVKNTGVDFVITLDLEK